MFLTREDSSVAAAELRVKARASALRVDWRNVKESGRNALTGGPVLGSLAVVGAVLGARSRAPAKPVECKCVKGSPSFLRVLLLAAITPLLENAVARGLGYLADHAAGPAAHAPSSNDAATAMDATSS